MSNIIYSNVALNNDFEKYINFSNMHVKLSKLSKVQIFSDFAEQKILSNNLLVENVFNLTKNTFRYFIYNIMNVVFI